LCRVHLTPLLLSLSRTWLSYSFVPNNNVSRYTDSRPAHDLDSYCGLRVSLYLC
jgi:hypothetical protein